MSDIRAGAFYDVAHPFILEDVELADEDGFAKVRSWRPGLRYEMVSPEDSEAFADGVGSQRLTVVSIHKPGRFPMRVFYTRTWTDPGGKTFGKPKLLIAVQSKFSRIINGYRVRFHLTPDLTP